ncbi:hypothetical protein GT354_46235, partial [Streptomyces sp. SID3343]|nr:hypothetical protein [Streptomyces sp. SID3343]
GASTAWEAGNDPQPAPPGWPVADAALDLAGRIAEAAADAKHHSDLLRDLLTGRSTDLAGWAVIPAGPLLVVVAETDPPARATNVRAARVGQEAFAHAWSQAVLRHAPEAAV